ncbi:MAG: alpha-hydroxy-acid oxidizing protein [Xanthomonadaceae bacterium]|nr:alpha-hydroxy-acid oxidizing protein [Xanthomonadaceae bacterium]
MTIDMMQYEGRKRDHIKWALDHRSQASLGTGFDRIHLSHDALTEQNLKDIKIPSGTLYVSGMTAGHEAAREINDRLALACVENHWAMGVGSQRRDLVGEEMSSTYENWLRFRDQFPKLELFANIGISQLKNLSEERLEKLLFEMNAQALVIHTNPLQESIQIEGTPDFRGVVDQLRLWVQWSKIPVVLKETGSGFSDQSLAKLSHLKPNQLHAIDVSGRGGTHWGRVEGLRAGEGSVAHNISDTFSQWGESTLDSVFAFNRWKTSSASTTQLWVSGGVRTGLDAAKSLALGAARVGYAKPAMDAALQGEDSLNQWMQQMIQELKIALFCTGCGNVNDLQNREGLWKIVNN